MGTYKDNLTKNFKLASLVVKLAKDSGKPQEEVKIEAEAILKAESLNQDNPKDNDTSKN